VISTKASHPFYPGNGVLELDRNDELKAIYTDVYPPGDVTSLRTFESSPPTYPQFRGELSLSPAPQLLPDASLTVTVVDYDLDDDALGNQDRESDWSEPRSSVVTVKSCLTQRNGTQEICAPTGHSELLTLVETDDAGTFTGVIQVSKAIENTPCGVAF